MVALCYNGTPIAMTGAMFLFAASAVAFWLFSVRSVQETRIVAPRQHAENSFASH
jgi:homospermidine synthase